MRLLIWITLIVLTVVPVQAQVPVSGYVLSLDAGNMLTQAEMRLLDEFGLALEDRPVLRTDEEGRFERTRRDAFSSATCQQANTCWR